MWDKFKRLLSRSQQPQTESAENQARIPSVSAADSPWHVPLLDVRPVTQTMLSMSKDPACARNALSYGQDDGTGFLRQKPPVERTVRVDLRYGRDRLLADGALFIPRQMEHKWALYFHCGTILCIRSWLRQVVVTADVHQAGDTVHITALHGAFLDDEEPAFAARILDYLLRTHALGLAWPAPLPPGLQGEAAALWCMSEFGSMATCAATDEPAWIPPERPLRSHSLLHMAVARGDQAAADAQLRAGVPIDLLAADGLAPLHWALAGGTTTMADYLLARGCPVDVRSEEGATPLMSAVQEGTIEQVRFLLDRGADPNAADARGFTALHRAAEMGNDQMVELLLIRGASASVAAQRHTPRSLAAQRGHTNIVQRLERGS